jgi:hypothetical protein
MITVIDYVLISKFYKIAACFMPMGE